MKAKTLFGLFLFLEKTVFRLNKFKFMTFFNIPYFQLTACRLSLSKLEA